MVFNVSAKEINCASLNFAFASTLEAALRGLHDALAEHKRFVEKNERIGTALRVAREALGD